MRFATIGILFSAMVIAVPAAAQPAPSPTPTVRKVVAATKLPSVTNVPLYFKVQSIALSPGEKSSVSGTNSVLYQLAGSTDVSGVGETKTLRAGDGLLIAAGTTAELKVVSGPPSVVLQFLLSTASDLGRPTATGSAAVKPGSLVYEPYGLVHQWGNPGSEPLTFVTFNINHEGVAAVLPGVPARTQ